MSKRKRAEKLVGKIVRNRYGQLIRIEEVRVFSAKDITAYIDACRNFTFNRVPVTYCLFDWHHRCNIGGLFFRFTYLTEGKQPLNNNFPDGMFVAVNSRVRYEIEE